MTTDRTAGAIAEVDARLRSASGTLRVAFEEAIEPLPSSTEERPRRPRRRVWLAAAAAVVLLAGTAAGVLLARRSPSDTVVASGGTGDYLVAGWLPDGFEVVSAQRSTSGTTDDPVLSLTYGRSSSADGTITLLQSLGADDLGRLPVAGGAEPRSTEVRGHSAVRANDGTNTILQWAERPGLVVTVLAENVTDGELDRFVEGLRAAISGEIDEVLRQYGQSSRLDELAEGEILVTEGTNQDGPWQLVASDDVETYRLSLRDQGGSSGGGVEKDFPDQYFSSATGHAGGGRAVFGMVGPEVAEVVAEQPGEAPTQVELLPIADWTLRAFVLWTIGDASKVVLVFRDASGVELGRSS
jgi:hypothetical protein